MENIEEYVMKKYPRKFKGVKPIIEEFDSHWAVKKSKDASPLILSKQIKIN